MDPTAPLSTQRMASLTAELASATAARLGVEQKRVGAGITRLRKPPKGMAYAYEVTILIDQKPPTDEQNAKLAPLVSAALNNAIRWALAN